MEWGAALGEDTRQRIVASSAVAVISVSGDTLADYARGGSAAEAVWITAQQHGLAVQPISPVFLYARDIKDLAELSSAFADELSDLPKEFQQLARYRLPLPLLWCCDSLSVTQLRCGAVAVLIASFAKAPTPATVRTMPALWLIRHRGGCRIDGGHRGNSAAISERVIAELVSHFGVDFGFLRHNDHTIHATVLVASWPPRADVPDPDPIGVVYFADADSVFARAENMKEPDVLRPEPTNDDYQNNIEERHGCSCQLARSRASVVRRRHHRNLGLCQVRRPGMEAGGTECAASDCNPIRSAAGPHRRRRSAPLFG